VDWPHDTVLACIVRSATPIAPSVDDTLEAGDELLIVAGRDAEEEQLQALMAPGAEVAEPVVGPTPASEPVEAPEEV
jgi:trk system potassium uptake protein TrkA